MLDVNIHFFNVNHGDSAVVIINDDKEKYYIVVDVNIATLNGKKINPSFEFLKKESPKKISALIITHLHDDHYSGVEDILLNFNVEKICLPPFFYTNCVPFDKIIAILTKDLTKILNKSSDPDVTSPIKSLSYLIKFISDHKNILEELEGPESKFRINGIADPIGTICLPLRKMKGTLLPKIISKGSIYNIQEINDSSIAIYFDFFSYRVLFSGDSTKRQWSEHYLRMKRSGITHININFLKVSHHGSKESNPKTIMDYYFNSSKNEKKCFISANGITHPHIETINIFSENKFSLYCTNLSKHCCVKLRDNITKFKDLPSEYYPFILPNSIISEPTPCMGDVLLSLNKNSAKITTQNNNECIYSI
jgi:beta-lactamase superfamily II metal-dependent hydrolase